MVPRGSELADHQFIFNDVPTISLTLYERHGPTWDISSPQFEVETEQIKVVQVSLWQSTVEL